MISPLLLSLLIYNKLKTTMSKDIRTFSKPFKPYISYSMTKSLDTWHILVPRHKQIHHEPYQREPQHHHRKTHWKLQSEKGSHLTICYRKVQKRAQAAEISSIKFLVHSLQGQERLVQGPTTTGSVNPKNSTTDYSTSHTLSAECGIKFRSNHGKTIMQYP